MNPIRVTTKQSDGTNVITETQYPADTSLLCREHFFVPIKETVYSEKNGIRKQIRVQSVQYGKIDGSWHPIVVSTGMGDVPIEKILYRYNHNGQISCVIRDSLLYQNYVYGYDGTLPIAIVEADREISLIDCLTSDESTLNNTVSQIRADNEDANRLVRTYLHKPLVGVTWEQGPDGIATTYRYDNKGRLIATVDRNGKTHTTIEYRHIR